MDKRAILVAPPRNGNISRKKNGLIKRRGTVFKYSGLRNFSLRSVIQLLPHDKTNRGLFYWLYMGNLCPHNLEWNFTIMTTLQPSALEKTGHLAAFHRVIMKQEHTYNKYINLYYLLLITLNFGKPGTCGTFSSIALGLKSMGKMVLPIDWWLWSFPLNYIFIHDQTMEHCHHQLVVTF